MNEVNMKSLEKYRQVCRQLKAIEERSQLVKDYIKLISEVEHIKKKLQRFDFCERIKKLKMQYIELVEAEIAKISEDKDVIEYIKENRLYLSGKN